MALQYAAKIGKSRKVKAREEYKKKYPPREPILPNVMVRPEGTPESRNVPVETDPVKRRAQMEAHVLESRTLKQIEKEKAVATIKETVKQETIARKKEELAGLISQIGVIPPEQQAQPKAQPSTIEQASLAPAVFGAQQATGQPLVSPDVFTQPVKRAAGTAAIVGGVGLAGAAVSGVSLGTGLLSKAAATTTSIKGILSAGFVLGKVTTSARQKVKTANKAFLASQKNLADIKNAVNQGVNPEDAVIAWNKELGNIREAERVLKSMTRNEVIAFISGGKEELEGLEGFNRMLPLLNAAFERAILQPNPTNISNFINTETGELEAQ